MQKRHAKVRTRWIFMFVLWCFVSNLTSLEPYLNSIHWWKLQLQNIQYSQSWILANLQRNSNRIRALCLEEGTQRWHSVPLQSQVKPDGGKRNTTGIWQRIDKKLSSYTFVMLLVMMRSTFEDRNWHLWTLEIDWNGNSYVLCVCVDVGTVDVIDMGFHSLLLLLLLLPQASCSSCPSSFFLILLLLLLVCCCCCCCCCCCS